MNEFYQTKKVIVYMTLYKQLPYYAWLLCFDVIVAISQIIL